MLRKRDSLLYLEVATFDVGDVHVVRRWADVFVFLIGEDVNANHVDFSVAMFASLGGRHLDDFARTTLEEKTETGFENRLPE